MPRTAPSSLPAPGPSGSRRGRVGARSAAVVVALLLAGVPAVRGHGASRGLHLHLEPETASRGARLTVRANAAAPLVRLRIAFVGEKPRDLTPESPSRRVEVDLVVPRCAASPTLNLSAEGTTESGAVVRAAALLRLEGEAPPECDEETPPAPPGKGPEGSSRGGCFPERNHENFP